MSTVSTAYFHAAALKRRYLDVLDDPLRADHLSLSEPEWLSRLAHTPKADDGDPVRVDRLIVNDGSISSLELRAALLLSHSQTDNPRVYLYTLAGGIEGFDDRQHLLAALISQFASTNDPASFEYERVEGDPFRAQMRAIVEYQTQSIRQMTSQLQRMPALFSAVTYSLGKQLRLLLPDTPLDPATHLMRIVRPASGDDVQSVLLSQTLAQSAFEDYCKLAMTEGVTRQFLAADGNVAGDGEALLFAQALRDSVTGLAAGFAEQLDAYWKPNRQHPSPRAAAIESLRISVCHEIYRRGHDGTLGHLERKTLTPLLQSASGSIPLGSNLRCKRLVLKVGDNPAKALGGTFVLTCALTQAPSLLWFSPQHNLCRFDSLSSLAAALATPQGRLMLRSTLALDDQKMLLEEGDLQLTLEAIDAPLFAERVDSIVALQARNLQYVSRCSSAPEKVSAMFDDALDVRQLIDPRQLHFNIGRWSRNVSVNFAAAWEREDLSAPVQGVTRGGQGQTVFIHQDDEDGSTYTSERVTPSWLEKADYSDARAASLRQLDNILDEHAAQALQAYVCVASSGLQARDVQVKWLESLPVDASDVEAGAVAVSEFEQVKAMGLVSLLLERVSGHRAEAVAATARILLPSVVVDSHLDVDLINLMIERAAIGFVEGYLDHFRRSQTALARQGDRQLQPVGLALSLREDALRLDLALKYRLGVVDDAALSMVNQVLDSPARALRSGLGGTMTEVFALSLVWDDHSGATISDSMVLSQPENPDAGVMLWCSPRGWMHFASVEELETRIIGAFLGVNRDRWLDLVGERDRKLLRSHLRVSPGGRVRARFDRCDGDAIEALQQGAFNRQKQNLQQLCERAVRCRFEAGLFTQLARATELDEQLVNMLDALAIRIDTTLFKELLPAWLKSASTADVKIYNEIWRRYYLASDGEDDFLFGIPVLSEYARTQLVTQLRKDFPEQQWDPNQITVTMRRYVTAIPPTGQTISGIADATVVRSESLTDYAINRFVDFQAAALSVESVAHPTAVELLSPEYLRAMVRKLDVGASFMTLVRSALNPENPDWARRNKLFVDQLPPMMEAVAIQEKLEGKLSAQAYAFISRVLEMPDGIAREPVDGARVTISSLRLVADEGMTPDVVAGVYLFCPQAFGKGPVVLHAIYHRDFIFREYPSQAQLLEDIRSDESLQKLLLERLDPEVRKRYDHGGFIEPHLPFAAESLGDVATHTPSPVNVALAEETGNALQFLFSDTVNLLVDVGMANTVTTEQADQASRRFLGSLGLEQALSFLPGKLATMVALWQSHTLFRASAASASGRRWGEAISEFSAALGVMATARDQADKDELIAGEQAAGERVPLPDFSWGSASLTAEQLVRLRALEVRSISLKDLHRDDLLSLYRDKRTDTHYAAVAGKVYQVMRRPADGQWMIVGADGTPGPGLVLDARQRWQLDVDPGLKGGGGALTRLRSASAQLNAEDVLIIEAEGMPEIRTYYRQRAQHIGEAHLLAKHYLENCLDNLNIHTPGAPLDARVTAIIGEFFGANPPGQNLVIETERSVKALFDAVMDASLSPFSSPRFVVGSNRIGHESTMAFVIKSDPQRRVFLTERYFDAPRFALTAEAATQGFDYPTHYRAATLIHELSHLALGTHDIAYLETTAPYPDLLLENNANNVKLKADLEHMQNHELSHLSDKAGLFLYLDGGNWRDLRPDDGDAFGAILKITQCKTLEKARDAFLADATKRSRILFSNADSITLLVLRLGRNNFVAPSPSMPDIAALLNPEISATAALQKTEHGKTARAPNPDGPGTSVDHKA